MTDPLNGLTQFGYDPNGNLLKVTDARSKETSYTYDNMNRLTQITQGSSIVSFTYDDASRRDTLTLPNGVLVDYDYDTASRVTKITYKKGATVLGDLTYEYDKSGNRTKVGGAFARTGIPSTLSSAPFDAANRQTNHTYDNNGNLVSDGTNTYTWNARNQLASMTGPSVGATFVYDGLGRREKKTVNSNLTEFLHDGVNPVQETSGATVLANILTGLGLDEVFVRTDSTGARNFLTDGLGSTIALADAAGTIQTEYTYEPFGRTTVSGVSDTSPFQYTGRENDATGFYYYRARYYHPALQRFISEDPVLHAGNPDVPYLLSALLGRPQELNGYAYAGNNPINLTDPTGLVGGKCCQGNSQGVWRGRASRWIFLSCRCYWLCVPPEGVIWSGNWLLQPSTLGILISTGGGAGVKRGDSCLCKDPSGVTQSLKITLLVP